MDFWQISGIAHHSYSVISLTRRISAQIVLATCPEARFCSEILRCAACERDLERPRVLLSAVHVTVRCCLCDIVMLSSCRGGSGGPFLYTPVGVELRCACNPHAPIKLNPNEAARNDDAEVIGAARRNNLGDARGDH